MDTISCLDVLPPSGVHISLYAIHTALHPVKLRLKGNVYCVSPSSSENSNTNGVSLAVSLKTQSLRPLRRSNELTDSLISMSEKEMYACSSFHLHQRD